MGQGQVAAVGDAGLEVGGARQVANVAEHVVKRVNVGVDDVVAQLAQDAQGLVVVAEEGGPHVRGRRADNSVQGLLEVRHGRDDAGVAQRREVGVRVRVRSDLVAVGDHAADHALVVVDVAKVVAVDEEGGLSPVSARRETSLEKKKEETGLTLMSVWARRSRMWSV